MKILLVGKSCSGKSTFAKHFKDKGMHVAKLCTTRECRNDGVDDNEYYFISEEEYDKMVMVTSEVYNNWKYGLADSEILVSDIVICTPSNVAKVRDFCKHYNVSTLTLFVDTTNKIRFDRSFKRLETVSEKEVCRRIIDDDVRFESFKDFDIKIEIHTEDSLEKLVDFIENL